MENLQFDFPAAPGARAVGAAPPVLVGVVSSGNLEVLLEPAALGGACRAEVSTAINGYADTWRAVLADFFARHRLADLRVSINDAGATPAVVSLRLEQALEELVPGDGR